MNAEASRYEVHIINITITRIRIITIDRVTVYRKSNSIY